MADFKIRAQLGVVGNGLVEGGHAGAQLLDEGGRHLPPRQQLPQRRAKLRPQRHKGEATAQGIVERAEGAVGQVEGADDVQVLGHEEAWGLGRGVGQAQGVGGAALVGLQQQQQLAENARHIAPVHLINQQEVGPRGVGGGALAEQWQHPGHQVEAPPRIGPEAEHKILVAVARVKLHQLDAAFVARAQQQPGQPPRQKRFAGAGRPLQQQVAAPLQAGQSRIQIGFAAKKLGQGIGPRIGRGRRVSHGGLGGAAGGPGPVFGHRGQASV